VARYTRDVDGILLLDKPRGMSSNHALQAARRLLSARKAGHTGSLDPLASGLLPLCFGEATKLSQFLLDADKGYWAVFRLGVSTDTYDADGAVTATRPVNVTAAEVERALGAFRGAIEQLPPMYSAVKIGGQPLYKLARAGETAERALRPVVVRRFELLDLRGDRLEVAIDCSKGTYVRTLAHDLGEVLGCGAHVAELRRVASGGFRIEQAVTLEALEALPDPAAREALLIPSDRAVAQLPPVELSANAAYYLCQGQAVTAGAGLAPGWVRLYEAGGRFLGLGQVLSDGRVTPKRLVRT